MISLKAFGGLELRAGEGHSLHSVVAQPKRQALLLYLAIANPRGFHRRETLMGVFWPELDDAHARAALSRAVHYLRQSLGNDIVLSHGHEEIGLDWARLWCDVAGFENALDSGHTAEGLALYRGDLLPGFYVDDAPEFEEWLTSQRERLRSRAAQSAWLLSDSERAAERLPSAIEWARRAASMSPFDEVGARRLISLLDEVGDRAGALHEFDELGKRLRAELESDPAPETIALLAAIRNRDAPVRAAGPAPAAALAQTPSPAPARHRSRYAPWAAVAALALIVALPIVLRRSRNNVAAASNATVAVMPFLVQGDSSAKYLSRGMVSLLAELLNQSGPLRALDARAVLNATQHYSPTLDGEEARRQVSKLKPRFVVAGLVTANDDSITITANLFDSVDVRGPPARAVASGSADDIARLVQTLAARLMLTQPTSGTRLTPEAFTALTPSLEALKHYMEGEQAYAAGHFHDDVSAYRAAATADTTFALAFLWLSRSATWAGDQATAAWAADRALKFSDKLALLNQFRVRAWAAYQSGHVEEAEQLYQAVLANDVAAADASLTLGEIRYHWGALLGWTLPQAREAFERAVSILGEDAGSIIHLARIAAVDDRVASLDSLIARAEGAGVDEVQRYELEGLRAFTTGDHDAQRQVLESLGKLGDDAAFAAVIGIAASTGQHADAGKLASVLTQQHRLPQIRAVGAMLAAQITMAQGQWRAADTQLKNASALPPRRALEYRAALATVPFHTPPANELRALKDTLAALDHTSMVGPWFGHYASNEIYDPRRLYLIGMLQLKLADTAGVAATIRQLNIASSDAVNQGYRRDAANLLRAELLHSRGKLAEALAALGQPHVLPNRVLPGTLAYPSAHERFLRAELYRELGKNREALQWYETFPDPAAYDLMYLAPVHFRMAQIYERLGNRAQATAAYNRFIALWAGADADLQPSVQEAHAKVSR